MFIVYFPKKVINHYRLKMVDIDGQFQYSPVVRLQLNIKETVVTSIYPNPFINDLQVAVTAQHDQTIHINLVDQHGRVILKKSYRCSRGYNNFTLGKLNKLQAGTYILQIVTDKKTVTEKLFKHN